MKILIFLLPLLFMACSSPGPSRSLASLSNAHLLHEIEIDYKKSILQVFPVVKREGKKWFIFYLQLKDSSGKYIDCGPHEISLFNKDKKRIPFRFEKSREGRYYLSVEKTPELNASALTLLVRDRPIKEELKLRYKYPSPKHSRMELTGREDHRLFFKLIIRDDKKELLDIPDRPEIFLEGSGTVEDLHEVNKGEWEFSILFSEDNQILYVSVRAMGVNLPKMYRYQHVEK